MVRITGIDRELSTLELLWHQGDEEEKMMLAIGLMKTYYDAAGQPIELKANTDDGMYRISVSKDKE